MTDALLNVEADEVLRQLLAKWLQADKDPQALVERLQKIIGELAEEED